MQTWQHFWVKREQMLQFQFLDQMLDIKVSSDLQHKNLLVLILGLLSGWKWVLSGHNYLKLLFIILKRFLNMKLSWLKFGFFLSADLSEGDGAEERTTTFISGGFFLIWSACGYIFLFLSLSSLLDLAKLCLNRKTADASATCSNMADFHFHFLAAFICKDDCSECVHWCMFNWAIHKKLCFQVSNYYLYMSCSRGLGKIN